MFTTFAACLPLPPPMLNTAPGASSGLPVANGMYSLMLVEPTAASAIQVQRASDNTYTLIGFDGNGHLDTSAIKGFCGSSAGYVRTWYDQSGHGNHLVQTTLANMFRIYDGTSIDSKGGQPALYMLDENRGMISNAFTSYIGTQATAAVIGSLANNTTTFSARYASLLSTDGATTAAILVGRNQQLQEWGMNRDNGWRATLPAIYQQLQQVVGTIDDSTVSLTVDGLTAVRTYAPPDPLNVGRFGVCYRGGTPQGVTGGYISEVIFWNTSLDEAQVGVLLDDQQRRYGVVGITGTAATGLDWAALGYDTLYDESFTTGHSYTIDSTVFTNTVDPAEWYLYGAADGTTPGQDNIGFRDPAQVIVQGSAVRILGSGDKSGAIEKVNVNGSNQLYGGGEIRFSASKGTGYNPRAFLFPASGNWPWAGHITLFEIPRGSDDNTLISSIRLGNNTISKTIVGDWSVLHTISWTWTQSAITLYLDGEEYWTVSSGSFQPTEPLKLVLAYDVGDGDPIQVRTPTTPQPSQFIIDRVTITKLPGLPGTGGGSGTFTNLPNYNLIFVEEFPTLAAEGEFLTKYPNWGAYPRNYLDSWGVQHRDVGSHYEPNILSVAPSADGVTGNVLKMRLHVGTTALAGAPADNKAWGAAPYPKLPGKNDCRQTFGRYEARFRVVNPLPGWKTAFLLWNTRNDLPRTDPRFLKWPECGETDFPEGPLTSTMSAFMHRYGATSGGDQDFFSNGTTYGAWHVVVIEWKPNYQRFIIDGVNIGTSTNRVTNEEMRWILQTESNLATRPTPGQDCVLEIDYVVVWSYAA